MPTDPPPDPPADVPPPLSPEAEADAEITQEDLDDAEAWWKDHASPEYRDLIDAEPDEGQ